jgi:hypothetical protein
MTVQVPSDALFAPVRSQTAFEETVERLGTAVKLGLLAPGCSTASASCVRARHRPLDAPSGVDRVDAERPRVRDSRSRRRTRSCPTRCPADPPSPQVLAGWRDTCDQRLAVRLGVAVQRLAALARRT